jgi:hypothetical protein
MQQEVLMLPQVQQLKLEMEELVQIHFHQLL